MPVVSKEVEARYVAMQDPDLRDAEEIEYYYREVYAELLAIEVELKEKKRKVDQLVSEAETKLSGRFITTFEAAKLTGESPQQIIRRTSRGYYRGAKIIGKWWISIEDIKKEAGLL